MSAPPRDRMESQTTPLGIYDRPQYDAITGIEVVAIALTALGLLGALAQPFSNPGPYSELPVPMSW